MTKYVDLDASCVAQGGILKPGAAQKGWVDLIQAMAKGPLNYEEMAAIVDDDNIIAELMVQGVIEPCFRLATIRSTFKGK